MTKRWKITAGAVLSCALLAGTGAAVVAAREQGPRGPGGMMGRGGPGGPGGPGGRGGILPGLRALDLSETQREQLKATLDSHKAEFDAERDKTAAARKAQRAAITAETFDEGAVRQTSADLAIVEADGAVLRAKVHGEVWALLTPEQQTKARELRTQMEQRASQMRERSEQRRGQRQQQRQRPGR